MSEQTTTENQNVAIESPINVDSQAEIVTDRDDVTYLSPELITGGDLRNIVTVKLTMQTGSFCVDVLKGNRLYNLFLTEYEKELIKEENKSDEEWSAEEHARLKALASFEVLVENIVKPKLTLKDGNLYIEDNVVPGDIITLLGMAYNLVNERRADFKAVQHFPGVNG